MLLLPGAALAEDGHAAWLRYARLDAPAAQRAAEGLPPAVVTFEDSAPVRQARGELVAGIRGMLGRELRTLNELPREGAIVAGTLARLRQALPGIAFAGTVPADGYWLKTANTGGARYLVIAGESDRAVLYGAFAALRTLALGQSLATLDVKEGPAAPLRWVNEWNNIDGSIERGYGGRSIFWEAGRIREDLTRVNDYGRLLASLGINGISINNVNANPRVLSAEYIPQVARVADVLRPWGVRLALAIDFGSPQSLGQLPTYDPLDPSVIAWWKARADDLYKAIPDFAGFVLKADSEGRVGPSAYRPFARRCRKRRRPRPCAARRRDVLPRVRLRPSHGLEQLQERSRARRLR